MSILESLHKEHEEILGKTHFIMAQLIHSLKTTFNDYPEHTKEFTEFVQTNLINHWEIEEEVIYPILKKKVDPLIVQNLIFDHERLKREFNEYLQHVNDAELAILHIKNLINYLEIHSRKEEELFSSVISSTSLSQEELKKIEEVIKH